MIRVNENYTCNSTDDTRTALRNCWILVSRSRKGKEDAKTYVSIASGDLGSKNAIQWAKDNKRVFITLFNLSRLVAYVDDRAEWEEGAQELFGKNLVALKKVNLNNMGEVEGLFYPILRTVVGTFEYNQLSFGGEDKPLLEDADWVEGIVYDFNTESNTLELTNYLGGDDEAEE